MSMRRAQARVEFPDDLDFSELRDAINAECESVAEGVAADARATAAFADKTGTLRKSISARKSKYPDGGAIVVATAPHAHLIEYGHVLVKDGKTVGHVPAHPFLRPALEKSISAIAARLGQ